MSRPAAPDLLPRARAAAAGLTRRARGCAGKRPRRRRPGRRRSSECLTVDRRPRGAGCVSFREPPPPLRERVSLLG